MARIFVTGSSTGLGLLAGQALLRDGHEVVLHARNAERAADTRREAPGAWVITGDLSTIAGIRAVADDANRHGRFDAVIHNAGARLPGRHARRYRRWPPRSVHGQYAGALHADRADGGGLTG